MPLPVTFQLLPFAQPDSPFCAKLQTGPSLPATTFFNGFPSLKFTQFFVTDAGVFERGFRVHLQLIETQNTASTEIETPSVQRYRSGKINRPFGHKKGTTMFKTASLTLAAIVASATVAAADVNYINTFAKEQANDTQVELGLVRAEGNGVVEIYSYHAGQTGGLLGSAKVHAGANPDVDVNIRRSSTNAIAVLKVGGEVVDTQEIDFK